MSRQPNPVPLTYSHFADAYDDLGNVRSCWTVHANTIRATLKLKDTYRTIVEVGCGTGTALAQLASQSPSPAKFVGIEPAPRMRQRAITLTSHLPNVTILDGAFEQLPLERSSADYMFSIDAFHWVTNLSEAMNEMARVLKPSGEMDHFFNGSHVGWEFIRATTPVYVKYMGLRKLVEAAKLRRQFTREEARVLFSAAFGPERVEVEEVHKTYFDTIEGHLGWWVRVAPQLVAIPAEQRDECDREVRTALAALGTREGIPYTIHQLHVRVGATR